MFLLEVIPVLGIDHRWQSFFADWNAIPNIRTVQLLPFFSAPLFLRLDESVPYLLLLRCTLQLMGMKIVKRAQVVIVVIVSYSIQ